ncbi:hypothetical protein BKA70DRAFT_1290796 [Coprinopsis sp. MPI-PUGE-AT-0042]|nr:hypothetical protein BKA70DRAFT_1290796 [Coprinopsis sp. MPI-PUGE-AT-0042]
METSTSTQEPIDYLHEAVAKEQDERDARRVNILGVTLELPQPNDPFFRRIVREHLEPFPPITTPDGPHRVPLIALCLPFASNDQLEYADRHNLAASSKWICERMTVALDHLRARLPRRYSRWTTLESQHAGSIRCIVLATNRSRTDLESAFDLDGLEKVRRLAGVRWIPTWNVSSGGKKEPDVDPQFVQWPSDLPKEKKLGWKSVGQAKEHQLEVLWDLVEVRAEVSSRVKKTEYPGAEIHMAHAFKLDEP